MEKYSKYSKYNTKHTDEFLDKIEAEGGERALGFYLGEQYIKDKYYEKNNSIPSDMKKKLNGLKNEGIYGDNLDTYYDELNRIRDEDED